MTTHQKTGDQEIIEEGLALLNKHFDLQEDSRLPEQADMTELHTRLRKIISWFLDNDLEKLLQIMYRIDISEEAFRNVLATSSPDQIATHVTDLVIEREWRKAETRLKYRT